MGNIRGYSPILCCEQYLKDSQYNSLHLERNYARRFVLGHYLFLAAHSSSHLGTDNVRGQIGQISEHIFAPDRGYCVYYPSNLFRHSRSFENWGIYKQQPSFGAKVCSDICPRTLSVPRSKPSFPRACSRKTVSFKEQIMSKDKYPSIFSPQMEAIVFSVLQIVFATRAVLKIGEYSRISPVLAGEYSVT